MPDTRRHRGPHPADEELFGSGARPALRRAGADLAWLLDRGYAMTSALKLVGDRHALRKRQRTALLRAVAPAAACRARRARRVALGSLRGRALAVDGYNVLITVEVALGGGVLLHGRDGCLRDLASLHGTFRLVEETEPALVAIGERLARAGVAEVRWLLDRPVSNSGRLRARALAMAEDRGWPWRVDVVADPDAVLRRGRLPAATADSAILDAGVAHVDLARAVVRDVARAPWVVDLGPGALRRTTPRGADGDRGP